MRRGNEEPQSTVGTTFFDDKKAYLSLATTSPRRPIAPDDARSKETHLTVRKTNGLIILLIGYSNGSAACPSNGTSSLPNSDPSPQPRPDCEWYRREGDQCSKEASVRRQ